VRRNFGGLSAARARGGFTLVELLVVIIIIAILAAIAVPAVMRATATAQNARIKTEIDMLHMAIQQYKNEYGSYPPAFDVVGVGGPVHKHIQRLFPRTPVANLPTPASIAIMKPNNALVTWLRGYSDNPTDPLAIGPSPSPKKKLFDFDETRINANSEYTAPSKPASPYIYIDSANYANLPYLAATFGVPGAHYEPLKPLPAPPAGASTAWFFTNVNFPATATQRFANPDSFQIISAGRDEKFGNDDDMSNFWPSTRKDYLDSLK
jgi:prepilin-type N-terminal cleavage/methylation domain-containing protein